MSCSLNSKGKSGPGAEPRWGSGDEAPISWRENHASNAYEFNFSIVHFEYYNNMHLSIKLKTTTLPNDENDNILYKFIVIEIEGFVAGYWRMNLNSYRLTKTGKCIGSLLSLSVTFCLTWKHKFVKMSPKVNKIHYFQIKN